MKPFLWMFAAVSLGATPTPAPPFKPVPVTTQEDANAKEPRFEGKGKTAKLIIPTAVLKVLKAHQADFQVDRLYEDDLAYLSTFTHGRNRLPIAVIADFDGNGRNDFAVRGNHGVVVVMSDAKGYRVLDVSASGGLQYVAPKKLQSPYEEKPVVLKNEAFAAINYEKSAATYYYENGEFKEFYTSD